MRGLKCLFLPIVVSNLAWVISQSQDCHQPGWTSGSTICFRLVHKPKSFQGAKEECQSLSGSLLTLDKVDEVMTVLGTSMVGNADNYRIDGWLNATWMEQDNQTLDLNTVESTLTLVLNVEDGRVSNSWDDRARLGFICQKGAEESLGCSNANKSLQDGNDAPPPRCNITSKEYLWFVRQDSPHIDIVPYPLKLPDCSCSKFGSSITNLPPNAVIKTLNKCILRDSYDLGVCDKFGKCYFYDRGNWHEVVDLSEVFSDMTNIESSLLTLCGNNLVLMVVFTLSSQQPTEFLTNFMDVRKVIREAWVNTTLPAEIDDNVLPVYVEPYGFFFFGGHGKPYVLKSNGSHWNIWEAIDPIPGDMNIFDDVTIEYFACHKSIFALITASDLSQWVSEYRTKDESNIMMWGESVPLFSYDDHRNVTSFRNFCTSDYHYLFNDDRNDLCLLEKSSTNVRCFTFDSGNFRNESETFPLLSLLSLPDDQVYCADEIN